MIFNLQGTYEQKLKVLGLATLEESRIRKDIIEMYKMMTGKGQVDFQNWFQLTSYREGEINTRKNSGYLNVREPSQSNSRVCNSLPDCLRIQGSLWWAYQIRMRTYPTVVVLFMFLTILTIQYSVRKLFSNLQLNTQSDSFEPTIPSRWNFLHCIGNEC